MQLVNYGSDPTFLDKVAARLRRYDGLPPASDEERLSDRAKAQDFLTTNFPPTVSRFRVSTRKLPTLPASHSIAPLPASPPESQTKAPEVKESFFKLLFRPRR
jgi:hypothetical protein